MGLGYHKATGFSSYKRNREGCLYPEDFYKFCRRVHGLAAPVETHCSVVHLESTKYDLSPCQTHCFQEDVFPSYNYKLCLQKYVPPK